MRDSWHLTSRLTFSSIVRRLGPHSALCCLRCCFWHLCEQYRALQLEQKFFAAVLSSVLHRGVAADLAMGHSKEPSCQLLAGGLINPSLLKALCTRIPNLCQTYFCRCVSYRYGLKGLFAPFLRSAARQIAIAGVSRISLVIMSCNNNDYCLIAAAS